MHDLLVFGAVAQENVVVERGVHGWAVGVGVGGYGTGYFPIMASNHRFGSLKPPLFQEF
jgi:hypothetical protein